MNRFTLLMSFVLSVCCSMASAQPDTPTLADALQKLDHGIELLENNDPDAQSLIAEAASELSTVITEQGIESTGAYHALGNAYMLQGEYGYAMLAYRRGEQINPRDPRIQDSLSFVRDQIQISVQPSVPNRIRSALVSWRGIVPRSALWWSFIALFMLGWLLLIARAARRESSVPRLAGVWCILLACLPAGALSYEWMNDQGRNAVVITHEINAMSGPDDSIYDPVYAEPLSAGVEGTLLESRDDWARLVLIDGSECWVPTDAFEPIRPPA